MTGQRDHHNAQHLSLKRYEIIFEKKVQKRTRLVLLRSKGTDAQIILEQKLAVKSLELKMIITRSHWGLKYSLSLLTE